MIYSCYEKLGHILKDIDNYLPFCFDGELNSGVEIVLSDPSVFRSCNTDVLKKLLERLASFSVSTHLPFYDLNFSSPDPFITKYSINVVLEALDVSFILGADTAVAHINLNRMLPAKAFKKWFAGFIAAKKLVEEKARELEIKVVWENTYEPDFLLFDMLIEEDDRTLLCLDVGHCNCFSRFKAIEFLERYKERIIHLHVHDNDGTEDSHLVPGEGNIDFRPVFQFLKKSEIKTVVFEIEKRDCVVSQDKIKKMFN